MGVAGRVLALPLSAAVNVLGQRALVELALPGKAELRGLAAIADTIAELHRLIRARLPEGGWRFYCPCNRYAPDGMGHICGCTTQLTAPETYARYIAPLDAEIPGAYPRGGTIHLRGHHTQHIACWREMEALRCVQLNDHAAEDFAAYFHGLRDSQVI